ncbi:MAG TPA: ABC transporter permease [Eubacteriales bacterium]|nr:ABC transporter permease [Clostridia bacterium]HRR89382.1 ABC transporter permease [Eubacteriales bacterium]HRU84564.1 ABC transporter permease [Eubacteriales bacterium]
MFSAIEEAFRLIASGDATLNEIIATTFKMAFASSLTALLLGAPLGVLLATARFPGKSIIVHILRTFMGLPPVVAGIVLYMLFSGTGPFGSLKLIYSVELMIIAQIVLITPIVAGLTESYASAIAPSVLETSKGLRLNPFKVPLLVANESKFQLISIYLTGFSRAIAEVGAVQIVGGNILRKTRVMTTVIALNYRTGQFTYAIALGIILLLISFAVNFAAGMIQEKLK